LILNRLSVIIEINEWVVTQTIKGKLKMIFSMALEPTIIDVRAFVDREKKVDQLKGIIIELLKAENIGFSKRYCVCGERGIGKSMLVHKVISDLKQEYPGEALYAVVDCSIHRSARSALEIGCQALAQAIREHFPRDKGMQAEADYLAEVNTKNKITWGTVKSRMGKVEVSGGLGVLEFLQAKIGLSAQRGEQISETAEIEIDMRFLRNLIQNTVQSLRKNDNLQVVFVLDNLDQFEKGEEIEELTRELFEIPEVVYILTIRNESISFNVRRNTTRFKLAGLEKQALIELVKRRLKVRAQEKIPEFERYAIYDVADKLASITDNPLSYLRWLHHLYLNVEMDASINTLNEGFQSFLETEYGYFDFDEVRKVADLFLEGDNQFLIQEEIMQHLDFKEQVKKQVFERLLFNRILIPNDVFRPTEYRLAPDLFFFKLFRNERDRNETI